MLGVNGLMIAPAFGQGPRFRKAAIPLVFVVCAALCRAQSPRLSNLSTRGEVQTAADIMIAGLVIGPGSPETVLIRAVGPTLTSLGLTGVLAAPVLSLYDSSGRDVYKRQG